MNALVFIETRDGQATPGSLAVVAKVRELAGSVWAIAGGREAEAVAASLAHYGVDAAWWCKDGRLDGDFAQPFVDAVAHVARAAGDACLVAFENSALAADVAAGVAARLEAGVNWDLQDLRGEGGQPVGTSYALNDSTLVDVVWTTPMQVAVFRFGVLDGVASAVDGRVTGFTPEFSAVGRSAQVVERLPMAAGGSELRNAKVVVAVGRGLKSQESMAMVEDLADALGGSVGVSLPLVDRGWYPPGTQVGQTGVVVKPRLYVACGISGALQHRVGMDRSDVIVAINTDPAAPIFGFCDAGVVGDLHTVVPELARLVRDGAASS